MLCFTPTEAQCAWQKSFRPAGLKVVLGQTRSDGMWQRLATSLSSRLDVSQTEGSFGKAIKCTHLGKCPVTVYLLELPLEEGRTMRNPGDWAPTTDQNQAGRCWEARCVDRDAEITISRRSGPPKVPTGQQQGVVETRMTGINTPTAGPWVTQLGRSWLDFLESYMKLISHLKHTRWWSMDNWTWVIWLTQPYSVLLCPALFYGAPVIHLMLPNNSKDRQDGSWTSTVRGHCTFPLGLFGLLEVHEMNLEVCSQPEQRGCRQEQHWFLLLDQLI